MTDQPVARWYRLHDPDLGEYSAWSDTGEFPEGLKVVDKEAADRFGVPLPAKPKRNLSTLTNRDGKPVDQMTKDELVNYAATKGIDVDPTASKSDIYSTIAAQEGAPV